MVSKPARYRQLPVHPSPGLAGASRQPNYGRFQVASDECTISRKTDSLYRRKLREQSMLHVKRLTLELGIPEGYRCEEGCVRRFTQLTASENTYRDAIRFRNGQQTLLQKLQE